MTWTIDYKSGVRQDHKGRSYRMATNSRGKQDIVYLSPPFPTQEPTKAEVKQVKAAEAEPQQETAHTDRRLVGMRIERREAPLPIGILSRNGLGNFVLVLQYQLFDEESK
jgi:hypothetical protein